MAPGFRERLLSPFQVSSSVDGPPPSMTHRFGRLGSRLLGHPSSVPAVPSVCTEVLSGTRGIKRSSAGPTDVSRKPRRDVVHAEVSSTVEAAARNEGGIETNAKS